MAQETQKMTAVEWLALRYHHRQGYLSQDDIAEAKAMEKEHIAKAWDAGYYGYFSLGIKEIEFNNGEEYYDINYNQTYNK
jgi:hypothetical protein